MGVWQRLDDRVILLAVSRPACTSFTGALRIAPALREQETTTQGGAATRDRLLDAAIQTFVERGFARSPVEQICRTAGTTKGAFFHHFQNKEQVGLLALDRFAEVMLRSFADGADQHPEEPVRRVFDYLDSVVRVADGMEETPSCLVAILTLELGAAHPKFREAANAVFTRWILFLGTLLEEAFAAVSRTPEPSAQDLAEYLVATLEGSLILARAQDDRAVIARSVDRFRDHLRLLLGKEALAPKS